MKTESASVSSIPDMRKILSTLKDIESDPCVSILLTTHRTHPANAQDAITLKNLVDEAEQRLLESHDKRHVWPILERIHAAVSGIDHNNNLEGLAVFANADMAEVVKLPLTVTDRVIIDHNFATRDLVRALWSGEHYYILTISGHRSRLIHAYRDHVVMEYGAGHAFPMENRLYNTHVDQRKQAGTEEKLMQEFCNRVDKAMQVVHADNPMPVLLVGDERNLVFHRQVADKPSIYIGQLTGSHDGTRAQELAELAFKEISRLLEARKLDALDHIGKAQGAGRLLDDVGDIYRAARDGRGDTLYVEEGHFQPARVAGDEVTLKADPREAGVMDDVIDEIAEITLRAGGHVVFMPTGSLAEYRKVCLATRY